jgi:hypothetical protein
MYTLGNPSSEQPYFIVDWDDNSVDTIYCSMNTNILMWNVLAYHIDTMVTHNYTIPLQISLLQLFQRAQFGNSSLCNVS